MGEEGARGEQKGIKKAIQHLSHTMVNTQKLKQEAGKPLMIHTSYKAISWTFSPAGERLWQIQRGEKHSYLPLLPAYI